MQYINKITSNAFSFKATFNTVVVALGPISHLFCIGGVEFSVLSTSKKKKSQMTLVLKEIKAMKNSNLHA